MVAKSRVRALFIMTLVASVTTVSWAADKAGKTDQADELELVTITGSRVAPRSAIESMVPVDVISRDAIDQTGSAELVETLASLVPAFSVQTLPALDATIFVRPARLRNLSPDQTLVLLNGKRVHRSAMMMNPSYGSAFQAPDLDQIPNLALKTVDVLREGAAAQYGSDAIAGVINLNLDDSAGFRAFAQYGQQFEGDGAGPRVGAHAGLRGDDGFFALTVEYSDVDATSRANQSTNAAASQAAYPTLSFPNPDVRWGKPSRNATRVAITSGVKLGETDLYAFGTYGNGRGVGDFNYRGPVGNYASLFKATTAFPGWTLLSVYPTGFTPHFGSKDQDMSLVAGVKRLLGDAKFDLSVGTGRNRINYFMTNSINASLGPKSPTSFDDGTVQQDEINVNLDGSLPVELGAAEAANFAFGVEYRREKFTIEPGDEASYSFGPGAYGSPALSCCSSGFPGYSPVNSGSWSQRSQAGYVDFFVPFSKQWSVDAAARYETFSTFGSSLTFKLSSRIEVAPGFALRGTASTGFRAPTPAQTYSEGLSQFLPSAAASITTTGRFSPIGPVASILNNRAGVSIKALQPEKSRNYSFGATWDADNGFQTTVDLYRIDIKNRLNTSTAYVLTAAENAALTALKIPNLQNIYSANFLQNDYDTQTQGVDVVAVYGSQIGAGRLTLTGALTMIDTEITGGSRALNPYSKKMTEDSLPRNRATLSGAYKFDRYEVTLRGRYYGEWSDWTDTFPNTAAPGTAYPTYVPQVFSPMTFLDLVLNVDVMDSVNLRLGAENVLDRYPDKAKWQTFRGLIYSRNSPYSTDGGYYYARLDFKF